MEPNRKKNYIGLGIIKNKPQRGRLLSSPCKRNVSMIKQGKPERKKWMKWKVWNQKPRNRLQTLKTFQEN